MQLGPAMRRQSAVRDPNTRMRTLLKIEYPAIVLEVWQVL